MGISRRGCPCSLRLIWRRLCGECSSHMTQWRLHVSGLVSKVIRHGPGRLVIRAESRRRSTRS
jgi:hypothetical protein